MPSFMSSVVKAMCCARASLSSAVGKLASLLASSRRLIRPIAMVGPVARRRPQSLATASSSSCGTTSLISPHSRAVGASTASPKNAICLARRRPICWGSDHDVPPSSASPRRTKIWLKRARSVASTRSQASTSPRATPTATPSTAAIVGFGRVCRREIRLPTRRISLTIGCGPPPVSPLFSPAFDMPPDRSAPEEKLPPAPVSTSALADGSCSSSVSTASKSDQISALIAFFFAGRFRVKVIRPPSRSTVVAAVSFPCIGSIGSTHLR